jgi:hypothetical protein
VRERDEEPVNVFLEVIGFSRKSYAHGEKILNLNGTIPCGQISSLLKWKGFSYSEVTWRKLLVAYRGFGTAYKYGLNVSKPP